ncbi:unnamed protein product [Anisakis simplex]|uniref:Uncharacterized protein n=1 Tax=Anisakis simplex TaxID=6269 RepID=A0A0M3JBN8_ANISI|nr:unnamed protein product [Anisakis simplex]
MDVRLTIGFGQQYFFKPTYFIISSNGEYDLVKAAAEEIAQSEAAKENDDHANDNRSLMDTDHSSSIEGSESEMK